MSLTNKTCVPCKGGIPPLRPDEIKKYLPEISDKWEVVENRRLKRKFLFKDFKEAMVFVNKVANLANQQEHHPDIYIFYSVVTIELWTHAIAGLHENDFIMAAKINEIN